MFEQAFDRLIQALTNPRNRKSSWGRWAGSLIIFIILATWSVSIIKTGAWIPLDVSTCLFMTAIFAFNAVKAAFEVTHPTEEKGKDAEIIPPNPPENNPEI